MKRIVWLASYPKSGNTWFRVFLTNLLKNGEDPANINDLERTPIASSRDLFDRSIGVEASDLDEQEADCLRPRLYEQLAKETLDPLYMKVHDAFTHTADGEFLLSPAASRGALYFIRNPLDIACSYANHNGTDHDAAIASMADPGHCLARNRHRAGNQLRQILLSWSDHVRSWCDQHWVPVHVVRYEDMKRKPLDTFSAAAAFAGLPKAPERIEKALRFSSIQELQRQERETGFKERPRRSRTFFRKGQVGGWKEELTAEQIQRIIEDHHEVMLRFGYLDHSGEPVA